MNWFTKFTGFTETAWSETLGQLHCLAIDAMDRGRHANTHRHAAPQAFHARFSVSNLAGPVQMDMSRRCPNCQVTDPPRTLADTC